MHVSSVDRWLYIDKEIYIFDFKAEYLNILVF